MTLVQKSVHTPEHEVRLASSLSLSVFVSLPTGWKKQEGHLLKYYGPNSINDRGEPDGT